MYIRGATFLMEAQLVLNDLCLTVY